MFNNASTSTPMGSTTNSSQMFSGANNCIINGGPFQSANHIVNHLNPQTFQRGMDILEKYIAPGAFHNSAERFDPPKCYPKTREAIQAKIMAWVRERPENFDCLVLWMYGPAGAGKSAIAQTIAELCASFMLLAASFFFSRTTSGRNDNSRLVATLTLQLIQTIPEIREPVLTLLECDPTVFHRTPETQMKMLIVDTLNQVPRELLAKRPRLVIIDGLDECLPPKSQNDFLVLLSTSLRQLNMPLYFLIASRPNPNIRDTFASNLFRSITRTLPLTDDYQSTKDIHHFLTSSFHEIRSKHAYLPNSWPQKTAIDNLVEKSSGQFIFAATVIRYIAAGGHGNEERLNTILALRSSDTKDTPFAMLDALYLQIFSSVADDQIKKVLKILLALICLTIGRLELLEEFLNYRSGELASVMEDMHSLVYIPSSHGEAVKIHHASLPDFLLDPARSGSFYLDPGTGCLDLARLCVQGDLFRPSTSFKEQVDHQYAYARIFSRCIRASPFTEELRRFLREFSMWDGLPPKFSLFVHSDICNISMKLLDTFWEWDQQSYPGWDQIYAEQLRRLDWWIYKAFLSVPRRVRPMILTAFNIYITLSFTRDLTDAFHVAMLKYILTHLGMELGGVYDTWNSTICIRTSDFITLIAQRIPIIFGPEFCVTDCHYTKFAFWCATLASKEIQYVLNLNVLLKWLMQNLLNHSTSELDFPLYDGPDISKFGIYLTVALNRCQESHELVDLLKSDRLRKLVLKQKYFTDIYHISDEISRYIERCERVFSEAREKEDNSDTCASEVTIKVDGQETHQGFCGRLRAIKKSISRQIRLNS